MFSSLFSSDFVRDVLSKMTVFCCDSDAGQAWDEEEGWEAHWWGWTEWRLEPQHSTSTNSSFGTLTSHSSSIFPFSEFLFNSNNFRKLHTAGTRIESKALAVARWAALVKYGWSVRKGVFFITFLNISVSKESRLSLFYLFMLDLLL